MDSDDEDEDGYIQVNKNKVKTKEPDWKALRPCFGWLPEDLIKKTFGVMTRYARNIVRLPFCHHFKTRFPALNNRQQSEPVATDTFFVDTPAVDCGAKCAQIFVGRKTLVTDAYPMMTDGDFVGTLEDNIRKRGAMDVLISDRAQAEVGKKVQDICRMYRIGNYYSEPHHQHQNFAENQIGTLKDMTNRILDRSGMLANCWLLCLLYACSLLNHVSSDVHNGKTSQQMLDGTTSDISKFCYFAFGDEVFYSINNKFPSESPEKEAYWVGIAENVGDALTWKLLTKDTEKVIFCSAV